MIHIYIYIRIYIIAFLFWRLLAFEAADMYDDGFIPFYISVLHFLLCYMEVSKNRGTPKSSHFNRVFQSPLKFPAQNGSARHKPSFCAGQGFAQKWPWVQLYTGGAD